MLGGFVNGLTGAGVGALWDGGHCSCEHRVEIAGCYAENLLLWGYNKSMGARESQSQFCENLTNCKDSTASPVMVKIGLTARLTLEFPKIQKRK